MKHTRILMAILAGFALSSAPARAGNSLLSVGGGYTGVFDNDGSYDFRAEYRAGDPLIWEIKPFAGVEVSRSFYGLGGVLWDWGVAPHFYITPSIGAGLYIHGGGRDLGSAIEFRPQIEGAYEFESRDRVSLALSHTSNAGIGSRDPGTEAVTLYYHMPLSRLTGSDSNY